MNAIRGRSKATGQLEYFLAHAATVITHEAKRQTKTTVENRLDLIDGEDGLLDNLSDRIGDVEAKIPQAASGNNQLADKSWVQTQLENIIGVAGGDSDTVINKFNEVVAFLNGIAESDPNLATQLLNINSRIDNKASVFMMAIDNEVDTTTLDDIQGWFDDNGPKNIIIAFDPEVSPEVCIYTLHEWTKSDDYITSMTFQHIDASGISYVKFVGYIENEQAPWDFDNVPDGIVFQSKLSQAQMNAVNSGVGNYLIDTVDVSTLITSGNQVDHSEQQVDPGDNPTVASGDPEESLEPQNP